MNLQFVVRIIIASFLLALLTNYPSKQIYQSVTQFNLAYNNQTTYLPVVLKSDASSPIDIPDGIASWSSSIAVSPFDNTVWVVNPDSGTVTVVDGEAWEKLDEIPVGQEPWSLAIAPSGQLVFIIDRATGNLVVVDGQTYLVKHTMFIGVEPGGIAFNPTGDTAYITLTTADEVVVLNTLDYSLLARVPVESKPYAIAVTDDGDIASDDEQVYITHFLSFPRPNGIPATDDGQEGHISVLDTASNMIIETIILTPDEHGFPNLLSYISIANNRAWLPLVRAAPALPRGLTTTVFAAVSVLDLSDSTEDIEAQLPLNDQEIFGSPVNNPLAAVPSPDVQTLYIVLAGSDLVEVVDISTPHEPQLVKFLPVGKNPRGMAISHDGRFGYVMNYLSRSLTVLDLEQLIPVSEITITEETLSPNVLTGKIFFNNAANPRLSQGSWISCASCHPDGATDGVTWMFPDGPRQTPPLWNAAQTLPWHWSAALDEYQDVEDTIQHIQHGLGLAPGNDPPLLGLQNAGRSADLDALGTFLVQGIRLPMLPSIEEEVTQGRELFQLTGCAECHGGQHWTISSLPGTPGTLDLDGNGMVDEALHQVGTLNPDDIRGEEGFDVPSLINVKLTAPYLHDGSMPTLETLLASGHPNPQGNGNGLDEVELAALTAFLRTIDMETLPVGE